MPHKPVTCRSVTATFTASLCGLVLVLCLMLISGSAWAVQVADPIEGGGGGGGSVLLPGNAPTLDEQNAAALQAAAAAAAQAILNNPGNTPSLQNQAAANLNAAVNPNAIINDQNPRCNQPFAAAYDEAQQKALTVQLAQDNKYFQYAIAGAYAAGCVEDLIKQAQKLGQGVSSLYAVVTAGKPVQAAVTLIANQILQSIFQQLVANLENQICSITNQLTQFSQSFLQNAVCLPSGSLQLGGLFNFNANLNLPNLQCDGIAINPLQLTQIDPQTGQPYAAAQGNYTSGLLAGNGGTGNYSGGVASSIAPQRNNGFGVPEGDIYGDGDATNIYGDPLDEAGDSEGLIAQLGAVSASSTFKCFDLQKAINFIRANVRPRSTGKCATYVREALCAGGLAQFCVGGHGNAKDYGASLVAAGYQAVADENTRGYVPQAGDIIVHNTYPEQIARGKPYGHIQMFTGSNWYSDYNAGTDMYGSSNIRRNNDFVVYRPKPTVDQKADGTCK